MLKLHLRFTLIFFYIKMNHFEAHLMVLSRVVDSKVLRMAIQFEYFFGQKGKIANVMLEILHGFSLV